MKELLTKIYNETVPAFRPYNGSSEDNSIKISFIEGAKVEILGDFDKEYEVNFIDNEKNINVYSTKIKNGMWCTPSPRYFVNWRIEVKCEGRVVRNEVLNLNGKCVKIVCDTNSMGDLLAFIGSIDEFQRKYSAEVHCVIFNNDIRKIFESSYDNIKFLSLNYNDPIYYAQYKIGYFFSWNEGWAKEDPRSVPLATIAPSILGLEVKEYKPTLKFEKTRLTNKKYVCIGIQSTAQCKYWNNPVGWNEVVQYLNHLGYEVWCIDKNSSFGSGNYTNNMPNGVIDKTGDFSLEDRMQQLAGAEFFIGIGSGLSWLAWSVDIPVILVSGFSKRWAEFNTPYRVINENVCNGCWNDTSHSFDKTKWDWCPRGKNFECTKNITPYMVIIQIEKVLKISPSYDFGVLSEEMRGSLYSEMFISNKTTYERDFEVEQNDVILDVGAHGGSFSFVSLKKNPKKIIAIEPLNAHLPTLKKNLNDPRVDIVNKAISSSAESIQVEFDGVSSTSETISFKDLIQKYNIDRIDFLKTDCEGGEYDIFTEENIEWILKNVKKISGEWHLRFAELKEKFRWFREHILPRFKNYKIYSVDGVDVTYFSHTEQFINYYSEIIVSIDNRDELVNQPSKILNSTTTYDFNAVSKIFMELTNNNPEEIKKLKYTLENFGFEVNHIDVNTKKNTQAVVYASKRV